MRPASGHPKMFTFWSTKLATFLFIIVFFFFKRKTKGNATTLHYPAPKRASIWWCIESNEWSKEFQKSFSTSIRKYNFAYSWYHFLSRYFAISWCAVPLNCCASLAIFSALSSKRFNLSPRSIINMWARLTSFEAELARVPSSWMFAFGPGQNLATDLFGLPLALSPTVDQRREKDNRFN